MLPLLAAALLVQDPPPDPPQAPDPPKGIRLVEPAAILKFRWDGDSLVPPEQLPEGLPAELADRLRTLRGDSRADLLKDLSTARESVSGGPRQIYVGAPDAPGELSSFTVLNFPFTESNPTRPAGPLTGTLKLTAADGTVTEYRAEFTPDPPAEAEPAPKYRLGIALDSMEPTGDPPGLPVREVLEDSPAAKAGVEDGDRVISVGDEPLASFPMLREKIAAAAEKGEPLRIKVVRGDAVKNGGGGEGPGVRILRFEVTPAPIELEEDGKIVPLEGAAAAPTLQSLFGRGGPLPEFQSFGPATVRPPTPPAPPEPPAIRRERAEARIEAAKAQLELARLREQRARNLMADGTGTTIDVVEARATLAEAQAAVKQAELDRRVAEDEESKAAATSAAEAAADLRLETLKRKYGPRHPILIEQQARLADLRTALDESGDPAAVDRAAMQEAVNDLQAEVKALRRQVNELKLRRRD